MSTFFNFKEYIPPCRPSHHKGIKLGKGTLFGYPGKVHEDHLQDVNVFLTSEYLPLGLFTFNSEKAYYDPNLPEILYYPIRDRQVPEDFASFNKLLNKLVADLSEGLAVAVSCHGGHGRTGFVLALLYARFHPTCNDPIKAIRSLGCSSWVESEAQAKYIFKRINVKMPSEYKDKIIILGGKDNDFFKDDPYKNLFGHGSVREDL